MKTRASILVLALAALALAWSALPIHLAAENDEVGYLALARDGHVLFDGRPYVVHPPVYPLAIRAVSLLGCGLPVAAILVGLAANAALVLLTRRTALAAGAPEAAAAMAALVVAASRALAFTAHGAHREPLEVALVWGLLLLVVERPEGESPGSAPSRGRLVAIGGVAALAALTYDLVGAAAPLLALVGVLAGRKRAGVVAALAGTGAWLAWALWRAHLLAGESVYPAGIDGLLEDTSPLSPGAFLNPNLLAETARHNAYFWPTRFSPGHLLSLVGPSLLAKEGRVLDVPEGPLHDAAALVVCGLALLGAALGAREPGAAKPSRTRRLAALALVPLLVGAPGLLGKQARYALPLLPLVAILAGLGVTALARAARDATRERATLALVVGLALLAGATGMTRPGVAISKPWVVGGRSVAWVASGLPAGARIAAFHGLPTELAWLLPGRRVLALPLRASRVKDFLERERPDLLVLPLALAVPERSTAEERDAIGLSGLEELERTPGLRLLGVVLEAEVSDRPRVHGYRLVAPADAGTIAPFGVLLAPGERDAAGRAVEAGSVPPPVLEALRAALARRG